jgi:glycosyltransferase involved in cell wall biosynthesis
MYDLSVIIPGNNEMFMSRTIEDILKNKRANTEIIAVLDGGVWANPGIVQHPDVNVIYIPTTIGQRGATNIGVKLSRAKYVMKLDAHCSWDEGYDLKMLEAFKESGDDVTMVGIMRNLWAYDWKCYHCGHKKYQGPTPLVCEKCGKGGKMRRKMMWVGKQRPQSTSYSFDTEPHFQYYEAWKHREPYISQKKTGLTETMSLQGSCFMSTRDKYWELNLSDENVGSWGNQGLEVACKTWLSGGRVLVNHKTWYAHMFRTQGGDFGFPYEQSGNAVQKTKQKVWEFFLNGKWSKQIHPVSWLIEKFSPVPGWTPEAISSLKSKENMLNLK